MTRCRALLVAAAIAAASCRRPSADRRVVPSGVSFGLPAGAAVSPDRVSRLAAIGVRAFFVPAVRGSVSGEGVAFERLAPARLPAGVRLYLEVIGSGDAAPALTRDAGAVAAALWAALAPAVRDGEGRVAGVHVAWPGGAPTKARADLLRALRLRVPTSLTISASIASRLAEEEKKAWRGIARSTDFVVVETFGRGEGADPAGVPYAGRLEDAQSLGVPVVAAYSPQGWGVKRTADGSPSGILPDSAIDGLSEDRRYDFSFGDLLTQTDEDVYVFGPRPGSAGGTIAFRERRVADLTRSLADARAAAGRLVRLASVEDDGRLVGLGVIEDILLGRRLEPRLAFRFAPEGNGIAFVAANETSESSALSRLNNWIDLRIEGARVLDVKPGDFDRYVFLDDRGKAVLAFRANTIRFFENFVAPFESMSTGVVRLSGPGKLFASAHLSLADGSVLSVPETRVGGTGDSAKADARGGERGVGRERQAVEREPER